MKTLEIKGARVRLGYKQRDMAQRLGISTNSYQKKESGIVRFTDEEKMIVSEMLGFDLQTINRVFFGGKLPLC